MKIFDPKLTGSIAFENAVQGNIEITGDLVVPGSITAREFKTEFVSASIIYQSGSTQFGDTNDDRHLFTGRIGIGTTDPQEELDIASAGPGIQLTDTDGGTARIINLGTDLIIQTDRDNLVDTSTIQFEVDGTEHMRIHTGGNVGIGTISPEADTHIYRADSIALRLESANAGATTLQFGSTAEAAYGRLRYDTGTHDMRFYTNNSEKVRIDSNGLVGIGTNAPQRPLDVINPTTGSAVATFATEIGGGTNRGIRIVPESFGARIGAVGTSAELAFNTSDVNGTLERVRIDSDGRVGIGRATVYSTLHIESSTADDTIITLDRTGTAAKGIKFNRDTETDASIIVDSFEDLRIGYNESGLGDNLIIHNSGSNVLVANSNGSVGIGTTPSEAGLELFKNASQGNPSNHTPANATLKIQDSSNQMYLDGNSIIQTGAASFTFGNTQDASILFYTNASEKVRFQNDGNVGIGATSPNAKLEIRDTAPFLRITTTLDDNLHELDREYGGIEWYTEETYGAGPVVGAYVKALHTRAGTGHTNGDMGLVFGTGTASNDPTATERMRINTNGNVGIGITSPVATLDVGGSGTLFKVNTAAAREFYIDTTNPDHLKKNQNLVLSADPSNSHSNTSIYFNIDGNEDMVLDSGGNLTIVGNFQAEQGNFLGRLNVDTNGIEVGNGSGGVGLSINDGGGNANLTFNHFYEVPDNASSTQSAGRISVSVDSATSTMRFFCFDNTTQGVSQNAASGAESLVLQSDIGYFNGNVGIGTTSPRATLDVEGSIQQSARSRTITFTKELSDNVGTDIAGFSGGDTYAATILVTVVISASVGYAVTTKRYLWNIRRATAGSSRSVVELTGADLGSVNSGVVSIASVTPAALYNSYERFRLAVNVSGVSTSTVYVKMEALGENVSGLNPI